MGAVSLRSLLWPASLLVVLTVAAPNPANPALEAQDPLITGSPVLTEATKTYQNLRRGVLSDLTSEVASDIDGILSTLGNVPSYVASGVQPYYQGLPTGDAVVSSLGLSDQELAAIPTQALNFPPYANFTEQGWNVRFHGNIYKQPNISQQKLDNLTNIFLINTSVSQLPESQADQARNVTAEIFVVQQGDVNVSAILVEPFQNGNGTTQNITLPYATTPEGDYDAFVQINSKGLMNGNETQEIQKLATWVTNTTEGNATAYLVPDQGLTVVSDIDDILRITKIWNPEQGLLNSFARPYTPWENMPSIYANWSQSLPNTHFHYLTTLPEQVTRNYEQFIFADYPAGSFDTRPLNFSNVGETLSVREYLLQKIFDTFPQRKFILVADTSNSDVMRDYPGLYHSNPDQVQCIFLRNTSATDPTDHFPYNTDGFKGIPQDKYMFFVNSEDLTGINIAGNTCYNTSVPQNLTFGYQGLPLGLGSTSAINGSANNESSSSSSSSSSSGKKGAASAAGIDMSLAFFAFVGVLFWQLL